MNAVSLLFDLALTIHDPEKSSGYIRDAKQAIDRINAIIGFTREFEDFGTVSPEWKRVHSLISAAIDEISSRGVRIENGIPESLEVYTESIIRKVFTTLMENAIRHGITISTIRFFIEEEKSRLIIICEDDGVGIPGAEKSRIFEHGFGNNTGIGLFLAREILSITGLTIQENGEEGKGARFEIQIPQEKFRFVYE